MANSYLEKELKQKFIQTIKSGIAIENVCSLHSLAVNYESQELEDFCFNFASNKMNQICKTETFKQMSETLLLKFFIRFRDYEIMSFSYKCKSIYK